MTEPTTFAEGSFCWVELSTADAANAKKFYTALFGWTASDTPIPDGGVYTMLTNPAGKAVGALYQAKPGIGTHWGLYVAVASADAAQKKAEALGGKIMAPAFDVMDVGRMSVIQDPTGAVFSVWQARKHQGAGVINEPNAFCWADLSTNDTDVAGNFYRQLFGWKLKPSGHDGAEYTEIQLGADSIGGITPIRKEWGPGIPSHWTAYFATRDIEAATKKAKSLGATVRMGPEEVPHVGKFSVLADPQGAAFNLFQAKA
jgi:predicted enzyme related to lactoylglutathione lyase